MEYYTRFDYNTYIITQDAIDSIKQPHIFNNEELNRLVQHYCKEVLRQSRDRKDGFQNEEMGILVDLDNNENHIIPGSYVETEENGIVAVKTINDDGYNDMVLDNRRLMFVHNHPNLSIISCVDMVEFLDLDSIKLLVAVGNDGSISYVLKTLSQSYFNLSVKIRKKMKETTWEHVYVELGRKSTSLGLHIVDKDISKYGKGV